MGEVILRLCDRIQHLQQQIETWQALLEKLAGNESAIAFPYGESPCYRMEWQFKSTAGCEKHRLRLLSKCPRCGARFKVPALWGG